MAKRGKRSTLTLRFSPEETKHLDKLKDITRTRTGSQALTFSMIDYPRLKNELDQTEKDLAKAQRENEEIKSHLSSILHSFTNLSKIARRS